MKNLLRLLTAAVVVFAVIICVSIYKKNYTSEERYKRVEEQAEKNQGKKITLLPIVEKSDAEEDDEALNQGKEEVLKANNGRNEKNHPGVEVMPPISPLITPTAMLAEDETKEKEPKATPYVLAEENQPGVQEGWGKIKSTITTDLTMKNLPQQGAKSVKRGVGQTGTSVFISPGTLLKLYGLYEGEREEIYRHVGVTYLGTEYYGYILADRIEVCGDEEVEDSVAFATAVSAPTTVPEWRPTVVPIPTTRPLIIVPIVTSVATEMPVLTMRPAATVTPVPTKKPIASATFTPTAKPKATASPTLTATLASAYELVNKGYYDYNVIPDKYNTGCYDFSVLEKINSACVVDGVEYNMGDNGNTVVIDLYYRNKEMADEVIIRNKDFSDKKFAIRHASMMETQKIIRFENCMFKGVALDYKQDKVTYCFENCSLENLYGSNVTLERCFFGGSSSDGLNPFQNVTVKDCYFSHYPQWNENGIHTDAMQVYGKTDVDAENIVFSNCRIEIPILERTGNRAINACFMVQLEYSNGRNFLFEDCIINGGGYSIYAHAVKGDWTMDNIVFRNISIGSGHLFGDLYPDIDENIVFDNLYDTEKLYVASVWKDYQGRIHLSVSNDTAEDRTLLIVTENGKQAFTIPTKATSVAAGAKEYYDLAIDMDIIPVDAESDWVVCYDGEETWENQIRYVNWSGENVYRDIVE